MPDRVESRDFREECCWPFCYAGGRRRLLAGGVLFFMATDTLISVREYLATSYRPDCDYVDGVIVERNVGERDHSYLQSKIIAYLYARQKEFGIYVFTEQRVRVKPTRFRIPDVCVVLGAWPKDPVFTTPPFICIEILSEEDRWARVQERIDDFLAFGVPYIWILDPHSQKAYACTSTGTHEVQELRTENPEIFVPLDAIFE
jgi:Uma2 family endonuclease